MGEVEYRIVPEFDAYRVGSDGSVWTRWKKNGKRKALIGDIWKQMKPRKEKRGYLRVNLFREDGKIWYATVHRLVLLTFKGPPPDGQPFAAHNNGVRDDNNLSNLRWASHAENESDKFIHGTILYGENNPKSKLTADVVRAIRSSVEAGMSYQKAADLYGATKVNVAAIVKNRSWSWLKEEDERHGTGNCDQADGDGEGRGADAQT